MFKRVSRVLIAPAVIASAFFMVSCAGEDGADGVQGAAGAAGANGENGAGCGIVTEGAPEGSEFGVKCGEEAVQWVMNGEQGPAGLPEGCTAVTENVPEYYDLG